MELAYSFIMISCLRLICRYFTGLSSLQGTPKEEASVDSESEMGGLLHDIHEALVMARDHGDLPPVRILRILAGEGHGMFNSDKHGANQSLSRCGVPLSAAMDYVGAILDDSSRKIHRLKVNFVLCVKIL